MRGQQWDTQLVCISVIKYMLGWTYRVIVHLFLTRFYILNKTFLSLSLLLSYSQLNILFSYGCDKWSLCIFFNIIFYYV